MKTFFAYLLVLALAPLTLVSTQQSVAPASQNDDPLASDAGTDVPQATDLNGPIDASQADNLGTPTDAPQLTDQILPTDATYDSQVSEQDLVTDGSIAPEQSVPTDVIDPCIANDLPLATNQVTPTDPVRATEQSLPTDASSVVPTDSSNSGSAGVVDSSGASSQVAPQGGGLSKRQFIKRSCALAYTTFTPNSPFTSNTTFTAGFGTFGKPFSPNNGSGNGSNPAASGSGYLTSTIGTAFYVVVCMIAFV